MSEIQKGQFSPSSGPVGRVLWDELLKGVIHITPLCSLLHILLKDGECVCRTSEYCKSLVLQDKCNIEIFFSADLGLKNKKCLFAVSYLPSNISFTQNFL